MRLMKTAESTASICCISELSAGNCSLSSPAFLASDCPSLSWQVSTDQKNWLQKGYEIEIISSDGDNIETTGQVHSSESIGITWPFRKLRSHDILHVRVRVQGQDDQWSVWSPPLRVEAPLFAGEDWHSLCISPKVSESGACPHLRTEFSVDEGLVSARLYVTSLGLYQVKMNGRNVTEDCFTPGWTVYSDRLLYQSYDVTALIKPEGNAIGAILAEGWYSGRLGFDGGKRNIWGDRLALMAQLEMRYDDGRFEIITTDTRWKSATGPILSSSIYDGECYDARLEMSGWDTFGYDDTGWGAVEEIPLIKKILEPSGKPQVRRTEEITPVDIFLSPSGKQLLDFGQNLVGRVRIRVYGGEAGRTVTIRHAEVLEKGELGVRPLRTAEATDRYTLKGNSEEVWEPLFTFHGFRYIEIENWPGEIRGKNITAEVLHSDMRRTGWFTCSDELLSRLHENVVWSMKGNFFEIPTDCPQRDERLGWTGDLQVFSPTASYLYDVKGFLASWLKDLSIEQEKVGGAVPPVVPNALGDRFGAAAWGDAATVVPSLLYARYGDKGILEDHFASMKRWVDFIVSVAGDSYLWDSGFQFGDWLDPTAPSDKPWLAQTPKEIVASAYFTRSAVLTAEAAAVLQLPEESYYRDIALRSRKAFQNEYVTPSGRMLSDSQTAYSLAIVFDLFEREEQKEKAGNRLAALVRDCGYKIHTGFVGTPLICDALSATGHYEETYRLLRQEDPPSWLYPVLMGGTTIWERWDSMLPDGSINPGEMTSFNHYALGAVADWMHRVIGGLAPSAPGYRRIRVAPRPGGAITSARSEHLSPYGRILIQWTISEDMFHLEAEIPANTRAEIHLPGEPGDAPIEVGSGHWTWSVPYSDPDRHGPYTPDDRIGDFLADKEAKNILLNVLEDLDVPHFMYAVMENEKGNSLRELLHLTEDPAKAIEAVNKAFNDDSVNSGV